MKLVRLTSNDNGKFTNSFGNEMTLAPMSSMALLNLTFQTNLGILIDIPDDETITFQGYERQGAFAVLRVTKTIDLPAKLFRVADIATFYNYIQFYLNVSIPFSRSYAVEQDLRPWTCSAYRITTNNFGFNQIEYRYAPFINPLYDAGGTGSTGPLPLKSMITDATQVSVTAADSVEGQRTSIKMADGVISTIDTNNNVVALEGRRLNDGTAFYCCRIFDYNDNGNAGVNDNGFSIGLSKGVNVEQGITIPVKERNFEINFNRDTESYKVINNGIDGTLAIPSGGAVLPVLVSRGLGDKDQEHDIVGFEVNSGVVSSCVYQIKEEVYLNLVEGNDWTQAPVAATEQFDTTNLGDIATYRRTQVGSAVEQWWEADGAANWNYYNTGPPVAGDVPSGTAVIDAGTGVITVGGTTFTPAQLPKLATTPTRTVLATSTLLVGEELYPYMYINGASVNVELNMLNYSIDPWLIDGQKETDNNDEWQITGKYDSGLSNNYEFLAKHPTSTMNTIIPSIGQLLVNGTVLKRWSPKNSTGQQPSVALTLPKEVWRALGELNASGSGNLRAPPKRIGRSTNYQINWALQKNVAYTSDNFIVVSDSIPLDSFDASRAVYDFVDTDNILSNTLENAGRRKNILMTIPENNNEDGLVEFETNTPIFIDMNNKTTINPRNLNFRILRKDFSQIDTDGSGETAVMTLLIKNGDK